MFISLYSFGIHIHGDVLENVELVKAWESYVLRSIFLLVMATHTPFIFFIGKESILAMFALCMIKGNDIEGEESNSFEETEDSILDTDEYGESKIDKNSLENDEKSRMKLGQLPTSIN